MRQFYSGKEGWICEKDGEMHSDWLASVCWEAYAAIRQQPERR